MEQVERLGAIVDIYHERFGERVDVLVDAGTRDGDDAAWLAERLCPDIVLAIDANPVAVERTASKYPEFIVVECALADFDGRAQFTQIVSERKDYAGSSSLSKFDDFGELTNVIDVDVLRMETLANRLGLLDHSFDVVKVDVEGFTFEFLQGLGMLLPNVRLFHLETEKFHRHEGHHDSGEVADFMAANGFELVDISHEWGAHIEDQIWVNLSPHVVG